MEKQKHWPVVHLCNAVVDLKFDTLAVVQGKTLLDTIAYTEAKAEAETLVDTLSE